MDPLHLSLNLDFNDADRLFRYPNMSQSILFVCTGNIFRSLVAEYALRTHLGPHAGYQVGSAGIVAKPQPIHPVVQDRLTRNGADPSRHVQRVLTRQLVEESDLVIAMGLDHQASIQQHFGVTVPLFNEVALGLTRPILDLHEALPDWEQDRQQAHHYIESVIDRLWGAAPALITRLPLFLPSPR